MHGRGLRSAGVATALAVLVATTSGIVASAGAAGETANTGPRPVVFVHGFSGSGAQFETQAKRFASNGYPAARISVLDYDSGFGVETTETVFARLDELIDEQLEDSGTDKVDLLGHSLGTRLMQDYLRSSPERAARVAHYVNLDGMPSSDPPGGVPTLAVWGRGDPAREIVGATNVRFDDQTHTQVVTSAETFGEIYEFFNDEEPETTRIVPERRAELSGRAVLFPQNTGVEAGTLEIYEVDRATGKRTTKEPAATFALSGDGAWGPFRARGAPRYEFTILRDGAAAHHLYYEPFVRSDRWIRLLTSPVDGGIGALLNVGDEHAAMTILRYKEWWGDQGAGNDVLEIDGVDLLNPANTPIDKRAIGLFVFDEESDGSTDLTAPMPVLAGLPFITGMDVFVAGSDPPDDTISVVSTPRGGGGKTVSLNVPNWSSTEHRMSIQFSDHLQGARSSSR